MIPEIDVTPQDMEETIREVGEDLLSYSAAIVLLPGANANPDDAIENGTVGFFIQSGMEMMITAAHVITSFNTYREDHPEAVLILGGSGAVLDITDHHVISLDEKVDIATCILPNSVSLSAIGKKFFDISHRPMPNVKRGEPVGFVGFPGEHRREENGNLNLYFTSVVLDVSSSSERHFILVDEDLSRTYFAFDEKSEKLTSIGGMSGAPAFVSRNGKYEFAGILYEGDKKESMMFISHSSFIQDDGTIQHNL